MGIKDYIEDEFKDKIEGRIDTLRMQRDELKVQMHLASMELRDEWDKLEHKWAHYSDRTRELKKAMEPTMEDVHCSLAMLGDELSEGYQKIKNALK